MNYKNTISKYILIAVTSLLFVACVRDTREDPQIEIPQNDRVKIELDFKIDPSYNTRVATDAEFKSVFEAGDQIGVFVRVRNNDIIPVLPSSTPTDNLMHNIKYTYDGQNWVKEGNTDHFYPYSGMPVDIYAYYPYSSSLVDPISIPYNVARQADMMSTSYRNASKHNSDVQMTFNHKLSLIQLEVSNRDDFTDVEAMLLFILPTGNLNLRTTAQLFNTTGTANVDEVNVTMTEGPRGLFRAYIPPQTFIQGNPLFEINADNYIFEAHSPEATRWVGGTAYNYTVTLNIEL